jgi:hypothetical protein
MVLKSAKSCGCMTIAPDATKIWTTDVKAPTVRLKCLHSWHGVDGTLPQTSKVDILILQDGCEHAETNR